MCLTSDTELPQNPELVGLNGAELKPYPMRFQPQPVQNMPHAGEAPVRRLARPLRPHTDPRTPQTRPLAPGAAPPSTKRPCLLLPPKPVVPPLGRREGTKSCRCCPGSGGWVVVGSKTLWGACSQGRAFASYDVCIGAPLHPPPVCEKSCLFVWPRR